jgi:SapC protein
MSRPSTATREPAATSLPLFYRNPQLLSSITHANWRLKQGNFDFAKDAIAVPVVVGEFTACLRSFPIVFTQGTDGISPIALLGLDAANLFVADGQWSPGIYVPAYVRRYPFGFIAQGPGFALAFDAASERIETFGVGGAPLFDHGKPTELTQEMLRFCEAFRAEAAATRDFCAALESKQLLIERRADAVLPNGRKLGVEGFQIVDVKKFAALDSDTLLEWHQKGWLALVHYHLASLDRLEDLARRREARDGVEALAARE